MNFFSYARVEIDRLFRGKSTWLVILLTMLCPLAGYSLYQPAGTSSTGSITLANPVLAGGIGGAVLFALLTLFEFDRVHKSGTEALIDSIASPIAISVVKLSSVLAVALVATLFTAAVYLPYTIYRMGVLFDFGDYIKCYFVFMLLSLWLAVLASSSFYQIFARVDLSFVLFTAFSLLSLSPWCSSEYLFRWINPLVPIYSNDFSNAVVFRTAGYSRLFWFALLLGFWLLSLLCVRNHGKSLFGSFTRNARKAYLPLTAVVLICCSIYLYTAEPYIDHSPLQTYSAVTSTSETSVNTGNSYAKKNRNLILLSTQLNANINVSQSNLNSTVIYSLKNSSKQQQKCTLQINPGYTVSHITANGTEIKFTDKKNDHNNIKDVVCQVPSNLQIKLEVSYSGHPKIWSQNRAWLSGALIEKEYVELAGITLRPMINAVPSDKASLLGKINLPDNLNLVSSGKAAKVIQQNNDGTRTWQVYDSSGSVSLFAGNYVKMKIQGSATPIYFYYSQRHQKQMEKLGIKELMENAFSYCTKKYGPLTYTEEEPLNIVETSSHMYGGGLVENVGEMDETSFGAKGFVNLSESSNNAEAIISEIVSEWWGNGAYCIDANNSSWTSAGIATYTTYRLMKEKYGEEYAKKNYLDVWKAVLKDKNSNFYIRNPKYQKIIPNKYIADLQTSFSTIDTHVTMASKIYKAAQHIGEKKMDAVLAKLYKNGGTECPPYITWKDFLNACKLKEGDLNLD